MEYSISRNGVFLTLSKTKPTFPMPPPCTPTKTIFSYSTNRLVAMEELYSAPYIVIHRADLHSVLVQEAGRLGAAIHLDSHFTRISFSDPSFELSNGKIYDADIILGAMAKDQHVEMPYLDTTSHRRIAAIMSSVLLSRPVMLHNTKA